MLTACDRANGEAITLWTAQGARTCVNFEQEDRVEAFSEPRNYSNSSHFAGVVHHVHIAFRRPVELHDALNAVSWERKRERNSINAVLTVCACNIDWRGLANGGSAAADIPTEYNTTNKL